MDVIMATDNGNRRKATMIYQGGMGNILVMHIFLLSHETGKYAQYNNAITVRYIPKGKRKAKGFVLTYAPYLVLLEGWQDIQSQDMFKPEPVSKTETATVYEGQYGSFDDRWQADFERETEFKDIIADYRGFKTL